MESDERAEVAALALGGGRFPEATDVLIRWCIGVGAEQRHRIGYLALLRNDAATGYLLDAVRSHGRLEAVAAARALATFKDDVATTSSWARRPANHRTPASAASSPSS